ncbi:MAG: right-handed parallel beta-helix repeat-containing protein, partial [Bacteroidales bacterium]|nr:right-handed parallel beta-helix repeat-containing protein [Bacteroidales bacterium]
HYGDLPHVEGGFWIDADMRTIHIHPFGWVNPNEEKFEITVKEHLLKPVQEDVDFVHVKGLVFEHCANSFSSLGNGAITTMGGHHWIFENNVIREVNSAGLEFSSVGAPGSSQQSSEGYINVINNKIYSCGTAGINSKKVPYAFVRENHIANCGWHEAEVYGECAGMKIYQSNNSVISHNRVHHISGGAGIWLEWGIENTHVTRNIIHDIATQNGALVINTSRKVNMVDNNFIWNVDGVGINGNNSENQLFYHNLIAYTSEAIVKINETDKIVLDSARLDVKNNQVSNNIFIDFRERMNLSISNNIVSNNAFVFNSKLGEIELKKWQEKLISKQGALMRADVSFNPNTMLFKWNASKELLRVPTISDAIYDFANEKRNAGMTIPGPFRSLLPMTDYYVSLKAK